MTTAIVQPASAASAGNPPLALENPAVARCAQVWERAYQAVKAKRKSEYNAECAAAKAFRDAMPPLAGYRNICDFIACVGYGMLSEIIDGRTATRLLYAAQVALSTVSQKARNEQRGVYGRGQA